jgi:hypothetical protein
MPVRRPKLIRSFRKMALADLLRSGQSCDEHPMAEFFAGSDLNLNLPHAHIGGSERGVPSENSIRPGIRIVRQDHRMISLGMFIVDLFKSRRRLKAESLFLRHQLSIALRRAPPRLRICGSDRTLLVWVTRLWPSLLSATQIVQPETILRWHRAAPACTAEIDRKFIHKPCGSADGAFRLRVSCLERDCRKVSTFLAISVKPMTALTIILYEHSQDEGLARSKVYEPTIRRTHRLCHFECNNRFGACGSLRRPNRTVAAGNSAIGC